MRNHLNKLLRRACCSFPRKPCTVAFITGAICITGWLALRDAAPPDISDLMIAYPEERDAVSFDGLLTWSASHPLHVSWDAESTAFSQGMLPPTDKVARSILKNRDSLQNLEMLIGDKGFISLSASSTHLTDDIHLAGVLLKRSARLHVHNGDFIKALGDTLFLTRLGVVLMRSSTTGSQWELGMILAGSGLSLCEWFLRNAPYSENQMVRISHLLDWIIAECPDVGLSNLAKHEYWALDQFISDLAAGKHGLDHHVISCLTDSQAAIFLARPMFRPNHARARVAMWQREVIGLSTRFTDVTEEEYAQSHFMSLFSGSKWWGNRYFGVFHQAVNMQLQVPGFRSPLALQHARNGIVALIDGIRLLILLCQYEREHGNLPDSLADLSPRYMKVLPLDPFGGKPFIYDKARRIVYSLGPSLVDHGGVHGSSRSGEGRFTFLESGRRNIVFPLLSTQTQ